jgi:hypothetical protein
MENIKISVLDSFSELPGLRHCSISDYSGEEFYHTVLNPHFGDVIKKGKKLIVDLDNTAGYAPSFLDEAFGNLVYDFTYSEVNKRLDIISLQEPSWIEMLNEETFPQWEKRRQQDTEPKVTQKHEDWYKYINGELKKDVWLNPS